MFGSGPGAFSSGTENTSGFGQTNTSIFNQTTQPNTGLSGSTAAAPEMKENTGGGLFGTCGCSVCNTIFKTGGTCGSSLFGTPASTSKTTESIFGPRKVNEPKFFVPNIFISSIPVGTKFSFGTPLKQPTSSIFGIPQPSSAETRTSGASTIGGTCGSSLFGTPASTSETTESIFGPQKVNEPNFFGQPIPDGTEFSFGTPLKQPTCNMFKCTQCSSAFSRKGNLVAHQKIHDGVRFKCTTCVSTFNRKSNLNRHIKNVHGVASTRTHSTKSICPTNSTRM